MDFLKGTKYLWRLPQIGRKECLELAATCNLSIPIVQVLQSRGLTSRAAIDSFIFSSFEKDVFHPSLLKDAQKAVDRICSAIDWKEKILVFGDYDVDGISASALAIHCLLPLGAHINFHLPHRVRDGYGLSKSVVERAAQNGYRLVITVDNGITAFKAAELAQKRGVDLIITDHHRPHASLPKAYAVVNPHRTDCSSPFKDFAGVGVIFKVLSLLYEQKGLSLPERAYELMTLGTIADVVPLVGENRYWVRHGLQHISKHESYALKILKQNAKVAKPRLSSKDIGFAIAPQLNALGRLEDPRQGVKFLLGTDKQDVEAVGRVLFELNQARKEIEKSILQQVVAGIDAKRIDLNRENCIMAASQNWPPGVIGLVASRLVGIYGKPAVLLHITEDGIAKGSCRSIPEFNIFEALSSARSILKSFGGHALAAGLSLDVDAVGALKAHIEECVQKQLTDVDLQPKLDVGAEVQLSELTRKFLQDIEYLEPFGNKNEQPLFHIRGASLLQSPVLLKDAHVKCQVFSDGVIKPLIFFNRPDLFEILVRQGNEPFDVAVQVHENYWNERTSIELIGLDVAHTQGAL